jgi:hypothetical protein
MKPPTEAQLEVGIGTLSVDNDAKLYLVPLQPLYLQLNNITYML